MRIVGALCVTLLSCLGGACSNAGGLDEATPDSESVDHSAWRPLFPDEALLCTILYNESAPSEVSAVLGKPDAVHDSGAGTLNFFYEYRSGAALFIGFQRNVFVDAMVDNAPYPSCWRDEEMALAAGLQDLRSMPSSNDQGGAR